MAQAAEARSSGGGLTGKLIELAGELRAEGMALGTAELLDGLRALQQLSWRSESDFREALAATLAKSPEDRRRFDLAFDRFMLQQGALAAAALQRPELDELPRREDEPREPAARNTLLGKLFARSELSEQQLAELRQRIAEALRGSAGEGALRDLARMAIAALGGAGFGTGVLGVDLQRIRRTLDLRSGSVQEPGADRTSTPAISPESLRRFEAILRRELEAEQIEGSGKLPPARPLSDLNRALPSSPLRDLAAVQRVLAQLRRRLASQSHEARGRRRHAQVDFRRTMRASLQTGGVPIVIKPRPRRPRRPEIYVVCDVSTSVTSASVFFLSVLHALHDSFRRIRTFVFIERVSEVTEIFERERDFRALSERLARHAGVADISGYTDYGRVWSELRMQVEDDLDRRCTLLVLGDARTNGRDPGAADFARLAAHAGRTFWLNPEPRLYWNYGDSVISAYEPHCIAFECWTTAQLDAVVRAISRPELARSLAAG